MGSVSDVPTRNVDRLLHSQITRLDFSDGSLIRGRLPSSSVLAEVDQMTEKNDAGWRLVHIGVWRLASLLFVGFS